MKLVSADQAGEMETNEKFFFYTYLKPERNGMTRELKKGKEWIHHSYKYRAELEVSSTIPSFYID